MASFFTLKYQDMIEDSSRVVELMLRLTVGTFTFIRANKMVGLPKKAMMFLKSP